ncbi:MAG: KH domain-containing protein [Acholeplasmatales bacterium]|jgi:predicted RNA-binding protein YlqC (UPF0109 family)|nr:KH domain-containing protein [Acholeplasmatales bacterium]
MIDFEQLLKNIVLPLVLRPEAVKIYTKTEGNDESILQLYVHRSDLGRIIGKQGRTATAIRNVLYAASSLEKRKVSLNIDSADNN